jgi:hypothetical protein
VPCGADGGAQAQLRRVLALLGEDGWANVLALCVRKEHAEAYLSEAEAQSCPIACYFEEHASCLRFFL